MSVCLDRRAVSFREFVESWQGVEGLPWYEYWRSILDHCETHFKYRQQGKECPVCVKRQTPEIRANLAADMEENQWCANLQASQVTAEIELQQMR